MKVRALAIVCAMLVSLPGLAQTMSWSKAEMDGSRTGCKAPGTDNVTEALGSVKGGRYAAPSGAVFRGGSVVRTARAVIAAQPAMAEVKQVIGYSARHLDRYRPESPLTNLFADQLLVSAQKASGEPADISIANFGGVRTSLEEGPILMDDLKSMFPFNNWLAVVSLKGSTLRKHLEKMASRNSMAIIGGARVVVTDGVITSLTIGGEPLDDEKIYRLATISFLLGGGDNLNLDKDALDVQQWRDILIFDIIYDYIKAETAAGRKIDYQKDGRVVIIRNRPEEDSK